MGKAAQWRLFVAHCWHRSRDNVNSSDQLVSILDQLNCDLSVPLVRDILLLTSHYDQSCTLPSDPIYQLYTWYLSNGGDKMRATIQYLGASVASGIIGNIGPQTQILMLMMALVFNMEESKSLSKIILEKLSIIAEIYNIEQVMNKAGFDDVDSLYSIALEAQQMNPAIASQLLVCCINLARSDQDSNVDIAHLEAQLLAIDPALHSKLNDGRKMYNQLIQEV